ncbi:MAG TPA: FHA domain-containing protein [Gemmatimonadales bacterium]|nr:FHA domain-containing protein [Gemmatimonadales bacterium]
MLQLEFGGQKYPIPVPEAVVGSEPGLAITLAGAGVQPRHAVLQSAADGSVSVRALAAGVELSLNGVKVGTDPHPILHGDKIKVGSHELLVVDPQRSGSTQYVSASDLANAVASVKKGGAAKPTAGLVNGRLVCLTDGREYAINRASLIMGRDASCDVVVESKNVSRKHAEIVTSPNGYLLIDHSTNGTLVNGEKIQGQRLLARSDMIRVGEDDFRFYADQPPGGGQPAPPPAAAPVAAPPPAAPAAQQPSAPPPGARQRLHDTMHGAPPAAAAAPAPGPLASLLIRSGARKGERVAIRVPVVNIGRADYNDVVLAEESVSTQHAKLQRREGVWMLVDLGSTNGSFVDGERIEGEAPVTPGATLRFGDASVIFDPKDEGVEVAKGGSTKMISAIPVAPPKPAAPAARTTAPVSQPTPAPAAAPAAPKAPGAKPSAPKPAPRPAAPVKAPAAGGGLPKWVIPAAVVLVIVIVAIIFLLK